MCSQLGCPTINAMKGFNLSCVFLRTFCDLKALSGLSVWILCFLQVLAITYGQCPKHLEEGANACMADYSTQFRNIQTAQRKLFSGLDVEILRAFCSGYKRSMTCIENLKRNCRGEDTYTSIEMALLNLQGGRTALTGLCIDDNLYEVYARFRTCFVKEGPASDYCFTRIMNVSIQLLTTFDNKNTDELCSEMRLVMQCIKSNIELNCGVEASTIVEKLVRPMVRGSSHCSFIEIPMTVSEPVTPEYRADQSGGRRTNTRDSGNGSTSGSAKLRWRSEYVLVMLWMTILLSL